MSLPEIDIGGHTYRLGKLSAMSQFHVARRIGPVVPSAVFLYLEAMKSGKSLEQAMAELLPASQPILDELARLSDDALDYVVNECMSQIHRREGSTWFPIWNHGAQAPMYEDVDMAVLLELTVRMISLCLGPFIAGWPIGPSSHPSTAESNGPAFQEAKTG